MSNTKKYHSIGLMSGSSLDGVDLAYCTFEVQRTEKKLLILNWRIEKSKTFPYPTSLVEQLRLAPSSSALDLSLLHSKLGHHFGHLLKAFIQELPVQPDFISSHGHTIYHYPDQQMTLQIGDGASIAALTGIPVYDNFRLQDIAVGGQGAPLAPILDYYLFNHYQYTLNLGGIANINIKDDNLQYQAYDVCGANQILNTLAAEIGLTYDKDGQIAAKGNFNQQLFDRANEWKYLLQPPPKSLGNNQVEAHTTALFKTYAAPLEDRLHTACHHIAYQVAKSIQPFDHKEASELLITGGGAHNTFLIQCIEKYLPDNIHLLLPSSSIIDYKESLLMSLLGLLNLHQLPTTLPSVTGASKSTIGGVLHQGSSIPYRK